MSHIISCAAHLRRELGLLALGLLLQPTNLRRRVWRLAIADTFVAAIGRRGAAEDKGRHGAGRLNNFDAYPYQHKKKEYAYADLCN